jgi:hypothetical protein
MDTILVQVSMCMIRQCLFTCSQLIQIRIKILPVQIKVIDIKEMKGIINSGNFKCLSINYCRRTEILII